MFQLSIIAGDIITVQNNATVRYVDDKGGKQLPQAVLTVLTMKVELRENQCFFAGFYNEFMHMMRKYKTNDDRNRYIQGVRGNMKSSLPCLRSVCDRTTFKATRTSTG